MRLTLLTSAILGLSTTALAQTNTSTHAPVVTDNEPYSVHHATLLPKDNTTVYGTITITARASSPALHVDVVIGGIPEGEYLNYHIHAKPIPSDSESNDNCYRTAAHLDPYNRGQTPPCNITAPWTCEVGDLSGKHGPAWAPPGGVFRASYDDFFLSNTPGSDAYFGDLSWVVHAPNSDRLSCGNFEVVGEEEGLDDGEVEELEDLQEEVEGERGPGIGLGVGLGVGRGRRGPAGLRSGWRA